MSDDRDTSEPLSDDLSSKNVQSSLDNASPAPVLHRLEEDGQQPYRLYKSRYLGVVCICVLNTVSAMNWELFAAITSSTATYFSISLTEVTWLANVVSAMYVVVSWFVPAAVERTSLKTTVIVGAVLMAVGAWLRFLATLPSSAGGRYALLFLGSVLGGTAMPIFQIIPPTFSQRFFPASSRTTSTMLMAISNPFGAAIADVLAPAIVTRPSQTKSLVLIMGIVSTALALPALLVKSRPPSPPSYSASKAEEEEIGMSAGEQLRAFALLLGVGGKGKELSRRQKVDFWIISEAFAVLLGFFCAFTTLINQIFEPQGYSEDAAGFFGAALIVAGLIAAIVTAPLMDRYFAHRLAFSARFFVPVICLSYFVLIWVIRPNDIAGIYTVLVILGGASFIMLPVALELAAEVVYPHVDPNTTSAMLYLLGNGLAVVATVIMNALRDSVHSHPPQDMKRALIFQGVFCLVAGAPVFFLKGRQLRREEDERRKREANGGA